MTVRETLMFAARLRLPSNVSLEEKRREHAEGKQRSDAIEAELQSMVNNGLMWVSCNGEASKVGARTLRCENRLADVEDMVHCVVPFSTLPTCNKLRSVLCCWAGQDHPLVADNCRFIDPRNKLNYG